ncbi:RpiB/LacA/LacB family sugar-phosphate isomerase [Agrobacterium tumefaciens]|uniref:RpiB/LacA/LacB family sugar-phosphate isomerase n=1 Tax=Agrobacterium tumefaciens TaxID=358 RepID=UPI001572569B|nr:RpiB/LacA/LacB family sugar-phosphate isomerase [Agrobacterium tumefaciens]NTE65143.1 RpiB/LacA/LacB family sugar-phosphate isomerase [Agrobacterium tumefaciens]
MTRVAIGGDSSSVFSEEIVRHLQAKGYELVSCGAQAERGGDYVDAASEVAALVSSKKCEYGVLFCNTGTGVSIVANKFFGVRAAMCYDTYSAEISKLANNANVIVLSVRYTGLTLAKEIVDRWFATQPSEEPRRINFHRKTDDIDRANLIAP